MAQYVFSMNRVSKIVPPKRAILKDISLSFFPGAKIGVLGLNGAGKSTLLKTLAGILPIAGGEIWFNDDKLSAMSAEQKSRQLAYLAQNTEIHWDLSAYDVIALGLPNPLNRAKEQTKVRSISDTFSVSHLLEKPFRQLSGGEKARVQLARCCIKDSPLLLADEPIAPLDPYYQIDIMEQLKSLTPSHIVVVAIHHLSLAYKFCDEVILLHNGKIIANGETQTVLNAENLAKAFGVKVKFDRIKKEIFGIDKLEI